MAKMLVTVRHGNTPDNEARLWPRDDTPLSGAGIDVAARAGKTIAWRIAGGLLAVPGLVVASPLLRTRLSADMAVTQFGYPKEEVVCWEEARERNFGPLTGYSSEPFFDGTLPYEYLDHILGVEPLAAVHKRAAALLERVREVDEDVVVHFGHKAFILGLEFVAAGRPLTDVYADTNPHGAGQGPRNGELGYINL